MTNRLGLVLALAMTAGCSSRAVGIGGDGGIDCTTLDEASCRSDSRCTAYAPCCCGGAIRCVAAGSPAPVCTIACTNRCTDPCTGKDEATCKSSQGCVADYCTECSCTPTYVGCRLTASPHIMCPALGCAQPPCGCDGLDQASCQAASASMGCTANFCPDCHGGQTYAGCTGPNEGAPACPQLCANTCRTQSDCASVGQVCLSPGESVCGGACFMPPPCASDAECGGGTMICDVPTCSCTGTKTCTQGCATVADCGVGQMCDATHRCVPQPCGTCPAHFACVSGGCQRQTCSTDASCGSGYCVKGLCYDTLGMCSFLPG